ncbi:MAG TPA: TRAP transporter large permease subunit, partial [Rhodospirillales bacterium]|nr:TRAP transporter large permease subunit [Rhodospirillales bacterium]
LVFSLAYFQTIGLMKVEELAAVPLFILMGFITEQAGLMERLFQAFRLLLAPMRGALYLVVLATATVFAMATGIVGAAVTVLGIMAAPIMIKANYDAKLSAGVITAGGTLGILIPPSVMLIVMGPVMGISVVQLYAASFGPGFLLAALYILYSLGRSFLKPSLGPPMPMEERASSGFEILREVILGMLPLAALITAALGSILAGLATPTEAAGMGALGALILAAAYRKLTWSNFVTALQNTLVTSSLVLFLAVASNIFGAVFARMGSADLITETLLGLEMPPWAMLALIMFLVFILGWPFEWPAVILVFLPIFYPVAKQTVDALGLSMVWFAALIAVNLQTAFLSPPVAMSAYYLKQVVPQWSLTSIYRGMFEFMFLQVIALILIMLFPDIAMWLPRQLYGP